MVNGPASGSSVMPESIEVHKQTPESTTIPQSSLNVTTTQQVAQPTFEFPPAALV